MKDKSPLVSPPRTQLVLDALQTATTPLEFQAADRIANRRLLELEKIVQGISVKWVTNRSDRAMLDQTRGEMGRITQALGEVRSRLGVD